MDEDRCENCYWYWSSMNGGYDCHRPRERGDGRRKRIVADYDREACGWFKTKLKLPVINEYEQYQKEWN